MDIAAGQPIGGGNDHHIEISHTGSVAQIVEARPIEGRAAIAIVAEDVCGIKTPALLLHMGLQARQLLIDRLGLRLTQG